MIFLVVQELLPESFAHSSPTEAAWGVTVGLVGSSGSSPPSACSPAFASVFFRPSLRNCSRTTRWAFPHAEISPISVRARPHRPARALRCAIEFAYDAAHKQQNTYEADNAISRADPRHPFMPGASPLADTLDSERELEDAGASAIVMRSLFEEQILHERFGASGFAFGPDRYLEQLRRIKSRVAVPVIASINGTTTEGWLKYARLLQRAEADAIELNFYHLATDPSEDAASVEARLLDIVAVLKESITIPLAVKLSPFYSSLPNLAARLESIGAQGLVLFNRFYQADIDPDVSTPCRCCNYRL